MSKPSAPVKPSPKAPVAKLPPPPAPSKMAARIVAERAANTVPQGPVTPAAKAPPARKATPAAAPTAAPVPAVAKPAAPAPSADVAKLVETVNAQRAVIDGLTAAVTKLRAKTSAGQERAKLSDLLAIPDGIVAADDWRMAWHGQTIECFRHERKRDGSLGEILRELSTIRVTFAIPRDGEPGGLGLDARAKGGLAGHYVFAEDGSVGKPFYVSEDEIDLIRADGLASNIGTLGRAPPNRGDPATGVCDNNRPAPLARLGGLIIDCLAAPKPPERESSHGYQDRHPGARCEPLHGFRLLGRRVLPRHPGERWDARGRLASHGRDPLGPD